MWLARVSVQRGIFFFARIKFAVLDLRLIVHPEAELAGTTLDHTPFQLGTHAKTLGALGAADLNLMKIFLRHFDKQTIACPRRWQSQAGQNDFFRANACPMPPCRT
jgi:hypothetical protein